MPVLSFQVYHVRADRFISDHDRPPSFTRLSRFVSSSDARIILKVERRIEPVALVAEPLLPRPARLVEGLFRRIREVDVGFALQDLQGQSRRRVPGDVAVQEPGSRVVGFEGEDEIAVLGQQGHVAARRVVDV